YVLEMRGGRIISQGDVQVFAVGHPQAGFAYVWTEETDGTRRSVPDCETMSGQQWLVVSLNSCGLTPHLATVPTRLGRDCVIPDAAVLPRIGRRLGSSAHTRREPLTRHRRGRPACTRACALAPCERRLWSAAHTRSGTPAPSLTEVHRSRRTT